MAEKDYEGKAKESEKDKPSALDVYEFLWRGRDFELSHLWQRSVFLGAFLLGIATIYAVYFKDIFVPIFIMNCEKFEACASKVFLFVFIPIAITAIGIIFSKLWIMMAKGSKAWYEVYEDSIAKVSGISEFWNHKSIKEINELQGDIITEELTFGNLSLKDSTKCDEKLLSTAGGAFSVSKINIMIGIVFLSVFIGLHIIHIIWEVYLYTHLCNKFKVFDIIFLSLSFLVTISICYISCFIKKNVKSSYLKEFVKE